LDLNLLNYRMMSSSAKGLSIVRGADEIVNEGSDFQAEDSRPGTRAEGLRRNRSLFLPAALI
jgi:hypothetical protein